MLGIVRVFSFDALISAGICAILLLIIESNLGLAYYSQDMMNLVSVGSLMDSIKLT